MSEADCGRAGLGGSGKPAYSVLKTEYFGQLVDVCRVGLGLRVDGGGGSQHRRE